VTRYDRPPVCWSTSRWSANVSAGSHRGHDPRGVPAAPRILAEAPPSGHCRSRYCEALAPLRRRSRSWAP
jgi:hypothetical protein